jgi:hypothetical protein
VDTTIKKNEDGSVTWQTEGTRTNAKGQTGTMTGSGTATKTEGGVDFSGSREGKRPNGTTWTSETDGTIRKTEDGRVRESTTTGSDSKGHTWTADREKAVRKTGEGREIDRKVTASGSGAVKAEGKAGQGLGKFGGLKASKGASADGLKSGAAGQNWKSGKAAKSGTAKGGARARRSR